MKTYEIRRFGSHFGQSTIVKADHEIEAVAILLDITGDTRKVIGIEEDLVLIQSGYRLLVREIPS